MRCLLRSALFSFTALPAHRASVLCAAHNALGLCAARSAFGECAARNALGFAATVFGFPMLWAAGPSAAQRRSPAPQRIYTLLCFVRSDFVQQFGFAMLCALNCFCALHSVHRPSPLHLNINVLHWSPLYVYTCLACVLPAIVRTIGTSRHFSSISFQFSRRQRVATPQRWLRFWVPMGPRKWMLALRR